MKDEKGKISKKAKQPSSTTSVQGTSATTTVTTNSNSNTITSLGGGGLYTASYPISSTSSTSSSWYSGYDLGGIDWSAFSTKINLDEEQIKEIIERIFDSDDDLLPLVKNYLIKYLDQVMDEPEEIVKQLVKEKDEEIDKLKKQVDDLSKKLDDLTKRFDQWPYKGLGGVIRDDGNGLVWNGPNEDTLLGTGQTKWYYDGGNTTTGIGTVDGYGTSITCSSPDNDSSVAYTYSATSLDSSTKANASVANSDSATKSAQNAASYYDSLSSKITMKMNTLKTPAKKATKPY